MIKRITIAMALSGLMIQPSMAAAPDTSRWSYTGNTGPAYWADIDGDFRMCGLGRNQSPVDIQGAIDAELPPLQLDYAATGNRVLNNGHTVQVDSPQGNTLRLDGGIFTLQQMHFHAPSEHTIDGRRFPLEAHLVHSDMDGQLAVVTVLFEQGEESVVFDALLESSPSTTGEEGEIDGGIDFAQVLPDDQDYFRLNGSLTTPPCTEGVHWLVLKASQSLSSDQIVGFARAIGVDNYRPLQPRNARVVVE